MHDQTPTIRILIAMYRSSSRGRLLTRASLGELTALDDATLGDHLRYLDRTGYVDEARLRLTLTGLAVAVAAAKKRATSKSKRLPHAA